jgi:DNA repair photolyase
MKVKHAQIHIIDDYGVQRKAIAPIIISASRATDLPAFYSDSFFDRLNKGYCVWTNRFNANQKQYVSFDKTRLIVFWSKNPKPMLDKLKILDDKGINYYFQFTLNDYSKEDFERYLPSLESRIDTFIELSDLIGKEKVIWRFDPLIKTEKIDDEELLNRINNIASRLIKHTDKLVISFADISRYAFVRKNLLTHSQEFKAYNIDRAEFTPEEQITFAEKLNKLRNTWIVINPDFSIATCGEDADLSKYNILHNKCIDDKLISELFPNDKELMNFIGRENSLFGDIHTPKELKDYGQRKECLCILAKDIGVYDSCPHYCVYCYANASKNRVEANLSNLNNNSEAVCAKKNAP